MSPPHTRRATLSQRRFEVLQHLFSRSTASAYSRRTRSAQPRILGSLRVRLEIAYRRCDPTSRASLGRRSRNTYLFDPLSFLLHSLTYVQYRIRALGPTPVETYSSIISLAMCEISNDLSTPATILRARTPAAPHAFVWQSRAPSDAPDVFSTRLMLASLEHSIQYATRRGQSAAGAVRGKDEHAHNTTQRVLRAR
ncbi:hypothetical protein B0H14DRAFT_3494979 [Mycena olivaceomarginata]|nr:hypothetical protein B0H14DRAFT_3494979 [Mycena olivaceomarginata]